jgi:hypothetical protein
VRLFNFELSGKEAERSIMLIGKTVEALAPAVAAFVKAMRELRMPAGVGVTMAANGTASPPQLEG